MITPSQIKEKVLSTASHGYDIDETNAFLQQIEESFSAIYDENKELYRKMEILASKIEEYRAEEDSIKDTLLTAQKAASKVEKEAKEKSEQLLADSAKTVQNTVMDAKTKAEKIISEARDYAAGITKEKADAAEAILSEANEKAQKELADIAVGHDGLQPALRRNEQDALAGLVQLFQGIQHTGIFVDQQLVDAQHGRSPLFRGCIVTAPAARR